MLNRCLSFLNNTSLGAPVIGILWLLCFSKAYAIETHTQTIWILFSSIWLVYAVDRLLEREDSMTQLRHRFHIRHARIFWISAAFVVILNGWIIWHSDLPLILYKGGILVGTGSTIYLFGVFLVPNSPTKEWIKNILVALIFTVGVTLPVWVTLMEKGTTFLHLILELLSMSLLILTNLRMIGATEHTAEKLPLETIMSGSLIAMIALIFPSELNMFFLISYLSQLLIWNFDPARTHAAHYDFALIPVAIVFLAL